MDPLAPLISALHAQGRLRVWSLVITVFGDLVQHRGGVVSTTRLRVVFGRIGVEQGALRTALSRLTGDGWVTRERVGRASFYRLSPQGIARFAPATTRIYAAPREQRVTRWALGVTQAENGAKEFRICPAEEATGEADLVVTGELTSLSDGFRATLLTVEHRQALNDLSNDLVALSNARIRTPLDAAAARVLLIHRWRRIVLRYPELAADLMPADAPLCNPRSDVARVYTMLCPACEHWLGGTHDGLKPMPKETVPATNRFREIRDA